MANVVTMTIHRLHKVWKKAKPRKADPVPMSGGIRLFPLVDGK